MNKSVTLILILMSGLFQIAQSQSYSLVLRMKSDSSDYKEMVQKYQEIQNFNIIQQIEFFKNIQDSLETEIAQLPDKEQAKSHKKKIQLFFEQLQENLIELQRLLQVNEQLFYEVDSLQQLFFIAYEKGQIPNGQQYRRYQRKIKLKKKRSQYQNNVLDLEDKKQSAFVDTKNLDEFFTTKGWNESLFNELMNYMNKAIDDLKEQRLEEMTATIRKIELERKRQIDSLEEVANSRSKQIFNQQKAIQIQRNLIDSLSAIVHEKTVSRQLLATTIKDTESSLNTVQSRLFAKTDQLEEVQHKLVGLSKKSNFLSLKNQELTSSSQQLQKDVAELEIKGKEQTTQNELLKLNQVKLIEKQEELLKAKIKTDTWLPGLAAASTIGLLLLTFTTNRMNKEKQKVTKAYSELEQTKNLLQRKTEELNLSHRELNHRIKNNLQQISSLIYLQEDEIEDEQARAAFSALQGRIDTIKIVHQKLYSRKQQQLTMVNMAEYIQDLVKYIVGRDATIHLSIPDIAIEMDHATDIGLIINELVTNASKYAFPLTDRPELWVQVEIEHNQLFLTVKDNGLGFPPNFSLDQITSFGLTSIVEMFVHKSGRGSLNTYNEGGAVVKIAMPFNSKTGKLVA